MWQDVLQDCLAVPSPTATQLTAGRIPVVYQCKFCIQTFPSMSAAKDHELDCKKGSDGRSREAGEEKRVNGRDGARGPEQTELCGVADTEGGGTGLETDARRGRAPESGPDRPIERQSDRAGTESMSGKDTPGLDGDQEGQGSVGCSRPGLRPSPLTVPALDERTRMQHAKEILTAKTEVEDGELPSGSLDKNWMRVKADVIRRERPFWNLLFGVDETAAFAHEAVRRKVRPGRLCDTCEDWGNFVG